MPKIIDLDAVLGDDKQVRLDKVTYVLPPDLPVELYLQINKFSDEGGVDDVQALYDALLGLFRYKQPDLTAIPISMTQLVAAVGRIYGDGDGDGEADAPPPRQQATRGGAGSSTTPRKTRSRS